MDEFVQSFVDNFKKSCYERDAEAFLAFYSDDVMVFDAWHWRYDGKQAYRLMIEDWFKGLDDEGIMLEVNFKNVNATTRETMMVITAEVEFVGNAESETRQQLTENRYTFCLQETEGSWQVFHEHNSVTNVI